MKTIGLLGGLSWESTALYYRQINEGVKQALGGLHSAKIAMVSLDFQEIATLQQRGDWKILGEMLSEHAGQIEAAGADFLPICTNTMHIVADQVRAAVNIPLLHLADATARHVKERGLNKVGLLGTRFTMEEAFYADRLRQHGLEVLIPNVGDREIVHRVIYDELCLGVTEDASRQEYLRIIQRLVADGAQGVIAGCTEIGLLVKQEHTKTPLFDTSVIHAQAAVKEALST